MRRRCGSGIGPGVGSAPERPSTPSPAVDPLRAFVETGGDLRISTGWISGQKLGMFSAAKIAANIRSKGEILQTLEIDHQNLWDFGEALECTKKSLAAWWRVSSCKNGSQNQSNRSYRSHFDGFKIAIK